MMHKSENPIQDSPFLPVIFDTQATGTVRLYLCEFPQLFTNQQEIFRNLCTKMIEITCNDRLGKKVFVRKAEIGNLNCQQVRIKCNEDDTIGDLKKLIAAQTGTKYQL